MYSGWNLLLVVAVLSGQSLGFFWPFNTLSNVISTTNAPESAVLDTSKRVAIIGMYHLVFLYPLKFLSACSLQESRLQAI
jgi:hypothetical protein